jgi:F0F1-type ATP synthase membrane subunit b/b'
MAFFKRKKNETVLPDALHLTEQDLVHKVTERQAEKLERISSQLQQRLKLEMSGMISEVVDLAIDNTRAEIEQMLHNELIRMLEKRIDDLVEQAIKTHLTKPHNREK